MRAGDPGSLVPREHLRRQWPQHILDHIQAEVEKAPEFTPEQCARIRTILAPVLAAEARRSA